MIETKTSRVCLFCGRALPRDAPKGFCPRCLLELFGGRLDPAGNANLGTAESAGSGPAPPPRTIRQFGDYQLLGQIAEGGMGIVFLARQISLNRIVALKMIRSGQLATTAEVQRF